MLLSQYFLPVLKEQPAEAQITSHSLMLRSGMIKQQAAGIYSWLPLGLKILKNIENIIRINMSKAGAVELLMPCIQPAELWAKSGRLDNCGKELLKFTDRHNNLLLFAPTNEDMITEIFQHTVKSYKELPKNLYHIQWKFRDEIRPRFGVMRAREFLMKDAYSFDIDQATALNTYQQMYKAYLRTFKDLGVVVVPALADNGPIGGNLSHEFHVVASTGESMIYYDQAYETLSSDQLASLEWQSLYAATEEKHQPDNCPVPIAELRTCRSIEVGHIFYLGTKYSAVMNAVVSDRSAKLVPVEMSSYGIGISRLVAAIIEVNHDQKGVIWPEQVAPFKVSVLNLAPNDQKSQIAARHIYDALQAHKVETLYDDTDQRAGSKFATADLVGAPWQVIIGPKKIASSVVELKNRATGAIEELSTETIVKKIVSNLHG